MSIGTPPRTGWAKLVPELIVLDFAVSLAFWTGPLGFAVAYARPDEKFAYLERPEGAQIMICERSGLWETGPLDAPFGRGAMFQIYVGGLDAIRDALARAGHPLHHPEREVWRNWGDRMGGAREIFVQDPDGYLLMIAEHIGERPLPRA